MWYLRRAMLERAAVARRRFPRYAFRAVSVPTAARTRGEGRLSSKFYLRAKTIRTRRVLPLPHVLGAILDDL